MATSKYLHTITGDPSHGSYQQCVGHSNYDYDLRHRNGVYTKHIYRSLALNDTETVLSPSDETGMARNLNPLLEPCIYFINF